MSGISSEHDICGTVKLGIWPSTKYQEQSVSRSVGYEGLLTENADRSCDPKQTIEVTTVDVRFVEGRKPGTKFVSCQKTFEEVTGKVVSSQSAMHA